MKGPLPAWLVGKTARQREKKRADYQLSSHATCPRHWQQAILQSMSSYQQALYCTCSTLSLRRGLFWVLISSELHSPMRHYRSTFLPLPPRRRCHCCSRLALPDLLKFLSFQVFAGKTFALFSFPSSVLSLLTRRRRTHQEEAQKVSSCDGFQTP